MEMFKIMKGVGNMGAVEFFSRVDGVRTRGHSLREKKMRVGAVLRQGPFSQTVADVPRLLPPSRPCQLIVV